jgi:predicted Fe-Mo cluster-binding NifX family protein
VLLKASTVFENILQAAKLTIVTIDSEAQKVAKAIHNEKRNMEKYEVSLQKSFGHFGLLAQKPGR